MFVRLLGEDRRTRQIGGRVDDLREVQLSAGTVRYRDQGQGPAVVFVHGLGVDGSLWRKVVPGLEGSLRCLVPDWPIGSHTIAMKPDADMTPRGVARLIAEFLEALDLRDVTLVANDTGGALAQLVVTQDPERVGRLILTPCDAFENFLPKKFKFLEWVARVPGGFFLLYQPLRIAALRRLPLAFGLLSKRRVPDPVTDGWVRPMISNRDVRRDTARFLQAVDPRDTIDAAARLGGFDRPVLLAWATEDRVFPMSDARRLAAACAHASIVEIPDSYTFVSEDQPERLAALIRDFAARDGGRVNDDGVA
jgi:pimeloyl-ACP methyl ester carboxylesterase